MILVAGGTGRLGTLVVAGLTGQGERVRVVTREAARAAHLAGSQVEVVVGDVRDPSSLAPAFDGVRTVVSAVQGFAGPGRVNPESVDRDGNANLIAASSAAGADMVLVSVVGAADDHPLELFRMKAVAETTLRASGIPWTIVRSTAFLELYLDLMRRSAGKSLRPRVFGHGENPINFAVVCDVADAVVAAVLDHEFRGRVVEVRGENLTLNEVALRAQRELGRSDGKLQHVPRVVLRIVGATVVVAKTPAARLARAAYAMDTSVMTADPEQSARHPRFDTETTA